MSILVANGSNGNIQVIGEPASFAYNRSAKAWNVVVKDEVVESFRPGKEGKRAAMMAATAYRHPEIARHTQKAIDNAIIQEWPIVDLLLKGGWLAASNHVKAPRAFGGLINEIALVYSQSDQDKFYAIVQYNPDTGAAYLERREPVGDVEFYCECPHHLNGRRMQTVSEAHWELYPQDKPKYPAPFVPGFGIFCKHIAAVLASDAVGLELEPTNAPPSIAAERALVEKEVYYSNSYYREKSQ